MKRIVAVLFAAVLLLTLALPLSAKTAQPQDPTLAQAVSAVQASLGKDTVGAALVLYENGERTMLEAYGYADIAERTRVTAETLFEIGDLSALFVGLAVQRLATEGKVALDADVTDYLPKEFAERLKLSSTVTLWHLLHHTAGFEGRTFDLRFTDDAYCFDTLEDALAAQIPSQIAPSGQYYAYSPFGIGLAAYVVECVTGEPYADYVSRTVLLPLGMTQTVLDPRADSQVAERSKGHQCTATGVFCVAARDGRSYAGITPANGALSTPADLCILFSHLLENEEAASLLEVGEGNGIFGAPALGFVPLQKEATLLLRTQTLYFQLALTLDLESKSLALVMTNTAQSTLADLPLALSHSGVGKAVESGGGGISALEDYEGFYAPATLERGSLVGRLAIKKQAIELLVLEDGTVQLGDRTFRQIGPGIFALTDAQESVAVMQLLCTVEGEAIAILFADGTVYLPTTAAETGVLATLLFALLLIVAVYFVVGGVLATLGACIARARYDRYPPAWRFVAPWGLSALLGALVLAQYAAAVKWGALAFGSFFSAMSVIALIVAILAIAAFLFAFFTAFTERGRTSRVARAAVIFVLFLVLCTYWNVVLL